jgi:hypothetical protein
MPSSLPEKLHLVTQIKKHVPDILLECDQWIPYRFEQKSNGKFTKPPISKYAPKEGSPTLSFDTAIQLGFPGIKMSPDHNFVAIDVDDNEAKLGRRKFSLSLFSQEFQDFISNTNTYMELTPSGCGVRLIFYCEDKHHIKGRPPLNPDDCIGGEMFANSGYVTITGNHLAGEEIKQITADELLRWVRPTQTEVIAFPKEAIRHPALSDIASALECCKLNQSPRVKKAYERITGQSYSHYDYWLKILAACHDYARKTDNEMHIVPMVVDWSKTDVEAFESEEDVLSTFQSFSGKQNPVTYATLFKFARLLRFDWPYPAFDKKGQPTGGPMINMVVNFEYMMNYHEIEVFHETMTGQFYVKCPVDIRDKFFSPENNFFGMVGPYSEKKLSQILWAFSQQHGYDNASFGTISPLAQTFIGSSKSLSLLELWLDTPPDQLPEDMQEQKTDISVSNLDYLLSCIHFAPGYSEKLIRKYFDAFFFEMMMPLYNPLRIRSTRSFMLLLTGPENSYKSTFFEELFPDNLSRLLVTSSKETLKGEKSVRDLLRSLVTSALVVIDEVEILYNAKNDSLFKTVVTSDRVDFVDVYQSHMTKSYKNAVLAGTTNKRHFAYEQNSNRRLAIVDVMGIDTNAMKHINWHHFYREYVRKGKIAMAKGEYPWKLSQEIINLQYQVNEGHRAKSNLEQYFEEVFQIDTDLSDKLSEITSIQTSPYLCKIKDIMSRIQTEFPRCQSSIAEFKHVAARISAKVSGTENASIKLSNCNGFVKNGVFKQGQYTMYMMPPIKTAFLPENTMK